MDILTPFLPRIAHLTPVDKSTLFVVGVSDSKMTKVRANKKDAVLSELKEHAEEEGTEKREEHDDEHIDTWA